MPRRNQPPVRSTRHGSSRQRQAPPHRRPRIGQHFLRDPLVATDIVAAAELSPQTEVLEVGPGRGALTEELLRRAAHVTAVELDEWLAERLRRRFASESRLTVIASGVLDQPPDVFLAEAGRTPPYVVVANLPYYITAPVMRHFLESGPRPQRMVVMVQKEVADGMAGRGQGFSLLGASVQVFGEVRELVRVRPEAFEPPPQVQSAVVRIDVYTEPLVPEHELAAFFEVVRAGFRSPRKQLHNSLASGLWLPPGEAPALLEEAGIDPMRRPATLSVAEWYRLYTAVAAARPGFAERMRAEGRNAAAAPADEDEDSG